MSIKKATLTRWALWLLCATMIYAIYILFKMTFTPMPVQHNFDTIAQDVFIPDTSDTGNCVINTEALSKANGVDMEMYYPCQWEKSDDDSITSDLVLRYDRHFTNSLFTGVSLFVSKINHPFTDIEIDNATKKDALINTTRDKGDYVSSSDTMISGFRSEKIILKKTTGSAYIYYLFYLIFERSRKITIAYMEGSDNSQLAYREFYNTYLGIFETLAKKTRIF
jgi:hypothetical protein